MGTHIMSHPEVNDNDDAVKLGDDLYDLDTFDNLESVSTPDELVDAFGHYTLGGTVARFYAGQHKMVYYTAITRNTNPQYTDDDIYIRKEVVEVDKVSTGWITTALVIALLWLVLFLAGWQNSQYTYVALALYPFVTVVAGVLIWRHRRSVTSQQLHITRFQWSTLGESEWEYIYSFVVGRSNSGDGTGVLTSFIDSVLYEDKDMSPACVAHYPLHKTKEG